MSQTAEGINEEEDSDARRSEEIFRNPPAIFFGEGIRIIKMLAVIEGAGHAFLMFFIEGDGLAITGGAGNEGATPAGVGIGGAEFFALPAVIKFPTILIRKNRTADYFSMRFHHGPFFNVHLPDCQLLNHDR
ncbi:MAG: hypothetical protein OEV73_02120 [Desulfobulbaceae bacterium]|nr:hypothetical protein [Desulfobulbaceae bacterium]